MSTGIQVHLQGERERDVVCVWLVHMTVLIMQRYVKIRTKKQCCELSRCPTTAPLEVENN